MVYEYAYNLVVGCIDQKSIDATTAWFLTHEAPSVKVIKLHKVSNLGAPSITTVITTLTSANVIGVNIANSYTYPGRFFGTEIYYGASITGYTGCLSTGA